MNILTKRGSLDNVLTYEHICDTTADRDNIESKYITLGTVCIVLQGQNDAMEVYMADSSKNWHDILMFSGSGSAPAGLSIHVCTASEVANGKPNIAAPLSTELYLVPSSNSSENNLYDEYIWVNDAWEVFGGASIDLAPYATKTWVQEQNYLTEHQNLAAWAKAATKPTYTAAEVGAATQADIATAIGDVHSFDVEVVQSLPATGVTHTIYFVPKAGSTNDVYDEYLYINNAWEMIGNTQVDLSNYVTTTALAAIPVRAGTGNKALCEGGDDPNPSTVEENGETITVPATLTQATGDYAHAEGAGTIASGEVSHAEGFQNNASGVGSHAEGGGTTASGPGSHAEGSSTAASGFNSHAEGSSTIASGMCSHAEGDRTTASGDNSHAEGAVTKAIGDQSHAEGGGTTANGVCAHVEGASTTANGENSHAEGTGQATNNTTTVSIDNQSYTLQLGAHGHSDHSEGYMTIAKSNTVSTDDSETSYAAHSEGIQTIAARGGAHAEGIHSKALHCGSHAEGDGTIASGGASHAEGIETTASGDDSHAEGDTTTASGMNSHAEGGATIASGTCAHAEGTATTASGASAHAEGESSSEALTVTINDEDISMQTGAHGIADHVEGKNTIANSNYADEEDPQYAAHAEGFETLALAQGAHAEGDSSQAIGINSHAEGEYTVASGQSAHAEGVETIALRDGAHAEGGGATASGSYSHAEGVDTTASGPYSHAEGNSTTASALTAHAEGDNTTASGESSHAEGHSTQATGDKSHAEGSSTTASGEDSHAEGYNSTASSNYAHAEGQGTNAGATAAHAEGSTTRASGQYSHAEGGGTKATSIYAHAEGFSTTAGGSNSHAEGGSTKANGVNAHAEGVGSVANGDDSHAEGSHTLASNRSQHVFGEYNTADTSGGQASDKGTYVEIVGNGTADNARSNARTLDWSGNEALQGSLTLGKGTANEATLTGAQLKELNDAAEVETVLATKDDLTTGKVVSDTVKAGDVWSENLISSSGLYTTAALDVSDYIDQKIIIKIGPGDAHSGTRLCGFCDSTGVISDMYKEKYLIYYDAGDYQFAELPVTNTHFFFSCSTKSSLEIVAKKVGKSAFNLTKIMDSIPERFPKNQVILQKSVLSKNYYIADTATIGEKWTDHKVSNSGSLYTSYAINVRSFAGETLVIKIGGRDAHTGVRCCGFCTATSVITSVYKEKELPYVEENGYLVAKIPVTDQFFFFSCSAKNYLLIYAKDSGSLVEKTVAYVSPSGDDGDNNGSMVYPYATVNKAISSGAKTIYLDSGVYSQTINLDLLNGRELNLINASITNKVVFKAPNCVMASSETQVSGYTKVYSATVSTTFPETNVWLFQDGIADESTLIPAAEILPEQRGQTYRCSDTKITRCTATTESEALTEIENATEYKWFQSGTTLYFSRPAAVSSTNPICGCTGYTLFNHKPAKCTINMTGIDIKYMTLNLNSTALSTITDCSVSNVYGAGAYVFDGATGLQLIHCEAARTFTGTMGDGFNAHSITTSGDPFAHQTIATLTDCWSHDNMDDGISAHERSEFFVNGGLFEYNATGGGVTPSFGSHCTCIGVVARKNGEGGFIYTGSSTAAEGGINGQLKCIDCLSESNNIDTSVVSAGYKLTEPNIMTLINCKALNEDYGFYVDNAQAKMYIYDSHAINCTSEKGGVLNNITVTTSNPIPAPPTAAGVYLLRATVADGETHYSWVMESAIVEPDSGTEGDNTEGGSTNPTDGSGETLDP